MRSSSAAPQSVHGSSSLKMHEQLHRLSPGGGTRPELSLLLRLASNLSILHVNGRARGGAADEEDAESFSYTRTTNALLCLTRCSYFPSFALCGAHDSQPDILHRPRSVLSRPDSPAALFDLCYLLFNGRGEDTRKCS